MALIKYYVVRLSDLVKTRASIVLKESKKEKVRWRRIMLTVVFTLIGVAGGVVEYIACVGDPQQAANPWLAGAGILLLLPIVILALDLLSKGDRIGSFYKEQK
jgi:uncharacterized membrane protein SirB2